MVDDLNAVCPETAALPAKPRCPSFALEARGLTLVRGRQTVLRNVHLAVACGETVVLQGTNGAGKTTLLHGLAGLLRPGAGRVFWFGEPAARSFAAHRRIGFLGHDTGLYLALTVRENLLFAGRMHGLDQVAVRAGQMLAAAGLQPHQHQQVRCLSRGQRQRLAFARSIIHDPALLFLDEPFTNLDGAGRLFLRECLIRLRTQGCAIVVASHEIDFGLFERRMTLEGGTLCPCASKAELGAVAHGAAEQATSCLQWSL